MSKALNIVKRWKAQIHWKKDWGWDKEIETVETELKDAKKLKKCYKNELKNVSYYNNLALKYKKALKIINDKRVDMTSLKESLALDKEVLYYNNDRRFGQKLTKEEYNFLKEIL